MEKNFEEMLIPEYLKSFKCIGGDCEDTCCSGWYVSIDEETFKKYKRVKDYQMKRKIELNITRKRSNPTKNNAAKMKLCNGRCAFLTESGWCELQTNLGEEYLCQTCKIYPRITNKVNEVLEQSLTLSCPEAARMILLNEDGIGFEHSVEENRHHARVMKEVKANPEQPTKWQDYFWELRIFTISLLQNRNYTLEERLIILGLFFNKLEELVGQDAHLEISNLIANYTTYLQTDMLREGLGTIPNVVDIQLKLCKELVDFRFGQNVSSARYLECVKEMLIGLNFEVSQTLEVNKQKYVEAYAKYYAPFMQQHDYMMENYLVNYVFKNCMPLDCETPFESYVRMILHYSLIKVHLIGMSAYHEELSQELVVKLIQSMSKTFEHNNRYFDNMMKIIRNNGYLNLASMTILIKN